MRAATKELYDRLRTTPWFTQCGQPLNMRGIKAVSRWLDAVNAMTDGYWEVVGYQQALALREAVEQENPAGASRWEELTEAWQPLIQKLVAEKIRAIRLERGFPGYGEMILAHNLRHALLEKELLEMEEPGFFVNYAEWILGGRLPCGVDAKGRLMVY